MFSVMNNVFVSSVCMFLCGWWCVDVVVFVIGVVEECKWDNREDMDMGWMDK